MQHAYPFVLLWKSGTHWFLSDVWCVSRERRLSNRNKPYSESWSLLSFLGLKYSPHWHTNLRFLLKVRGNRSGSRHVDDGLVLLFWFSFVLPLFSSCCCLSFSFRSFSDLCICLVLPLLLFYQCRVLFKFSVPVVVVFYTDTRNTSDVSMWKLMWIQLQ